MTTNTDQLIQLENALNRMMDPGTTNEEKQQIQQHLEQFKRQPDCQTHCYHMISMSKNQYVLWFGSSVLEELVNYRWKHLSPSDKTMMKEFTLDFILKNTGSIPPFVFTKLAKVCVDIGKQDWPDQYPDFFSRIEALLQNSSMDTCRVGLTLLMLCAEEFGREDTLLPSFRKQEIQKHLIAQLPSILSSLTNILHRSLECLQHVESNTDANFIQEQDAIASLALRGIAQFIGWAPLGEHLSPHFISLLFRMATQRTNHGRFCHMSNSSLTALDCLTELLAKKCIPQNFQQFLIELTGMLMEVLKALTNKDTLLMNSVGEEFLDKMTQLLSVFLNNHLDRLERLQQGNTSEIPPMNQFLQEFLAYTIQQPHSVGFLNCIEIWDKFVQMVKESEQQDGNDSRKREALSIYENGLSLLMLHLVERVRFATNSTQLEELDDEIEDEEEKERDANEIISDFGFGVEYDVDSSEQSSVSELQEYLLDCCDMIISIAELPMCAPRLLENLIPIFQELTQSFLKLHTLSVPPQASEESKTMTYAVRDLSTCCRIVSSVAGYYFSCSTETVEQITGWNLLRGFIDVAVYITGNRYHTRGPAFVELHSESISSIRRCSSCLAVGIHAGKVNDVSRLLDSIIGLILNILDTTIVPTPESVMHIAMELLACIPWVIPPDMLHSVTSMQNLKSNVHVISLALPLSIQEKLYTALSNALLPTSLGARAPEWEARKEAFYTFSGPVVNSLVEVSETLKNNPHRLADPQILSQIRRDASVLAALAKSIAEAPKPAKDAFQKVVASSLSSSLSLLQMYLSSTPVTHSTLETSRYLMIFFVQLLNAIRKELPREWITTSVSTFINLFHASNEHGISSGGKPAALLVAKFFELLIIVMKEPTSTFVSFIPEILDTCFGSLKKIVFESEFRDGLLTGLFVLLQEILTNHFRFFIQSTSNFSESGKRLRNYTSDRAEEYFLMIFKAIGSIFECTDIPPRVCKQLCQCLVEVDKVHNVFSFEGFQSQLQGPFVKITLEILFSGRLNLLKEELIHLVYCMANADYQLFFRTSLTSFIQSLPIDPSFKDHLLQRFQSTTDQPSFTQAFITSQMDLRYYHATQTN